MEWHLPLFFFKPLDKGTPYCIALGGADEVQYLFCMKTSSLFINRWSSRPQLMNEGAKNPPLTSSSLPGWWGLASLSFRCPGWRVILLKLMAKLGIFVPQVLYESKIWISSCFFSSAPDHRKFLCSFSRAWRTWHLESRKHVRVRSVEARTFWVVPGPR